MSRQNSSDSVTKEYAELIEQEIFNLLSEDDPDCRITLGQLLRLYLNGIPPFGETRTNSWGVEEPMSTFSSIHIFITDSNDFIASYPISLHQTLYQKFFTKESLFELKGLRSFLNDYQTATNTNITAADILDARVVRYYSEARDRYKHNLVIRCKLEK